MKKFLKILGISLIGLLILFIVLAFVMPTEHEIQVSKSIDAPSNMIYNAINDMRAHEEWYSWKEMDDKITFTLGDILVGKGASLNWSSEKMGNGSNTIVKSDPDTGIETLVVFDGNKPMKGFFNFAADGNKTKVTTKYEFETGKFSNVFIPFQKIFMKKTIKKNLHNLEKLVKKRATTSQYYGYTINEEISPLQFFVTSRVEIDQAKTQQFYASKLGPLFSKIQESEVEIAGDPKMLIYNFKSNENKIDMAAAIPVRENIEIQQTTTETIQPGKLISTDYFGDYSNIMKAHAAIQAYMTDRELVHNWPIIEENIQKDEEDADPSNLHIKISYPVAN